MRAMDLAKKTSILTKDAGSELDRFPLGDRLPLVGGTLVALGSAGVVVASLFYALSPPAAIAPMLQVLPDAASATIAGATTMKVAGTAGVFGDLVMAVGAFLLGIDRSLRDRPVAAAGWAFIMFSLVVFEVVDALVGFVLPPAASLESATFQAFHHLYGVFFLAGTALFGVGSILALASVTTRSPFSRLLAWLGIVDGIVALAAAILTFAGFPFAPAVGAAIGAGAILYVFVGALIAVAPYELQDAATRSV